MSRPSTRKQRDFGDDGPVSDPDRGDSPREELDERRSVLAELPHTRPQRPSRRRADARTRATPQRPAKPKRSASKRTAKQPSQTSESPRRRSAPRAQRSARPQQSAATTRQEAPRQGYEIDAELANTPVAPPSGIELLGALAELAGELASSGISAGGRLLKGAVSRLPGS